MKRLPSRYEARVERSIMNKRLAHSLASREETESDRFIFSQFFVIGAPITPSTDPKPHILTVYPSNAIPQNEAELQKLCDFCFPAGFTAVPKNSRSENLLLNGFVFNMTVESKKMFGIAIHFSISRKSGCFFSSGFNRHYPFCLCLLSEFPFYAAHLMFLTHLALTSIGISKFSNQKLDFNLNLCEELPTTEEAPVQFTGQLLPCFELDHRIPQFAIMANSKIKCPDFLLTELRKYILFKNPRYIPTDMSMSQAITFFGYQFLFSSLSIKNIVTVYTAMLLEYSVLFFSKDLNKLSFSIAGAQGLVYPFQPGVLIFPVLPMTRDFIEILESPVPMVCGIHYSVKAYEKGDVIVDLDKDKVVVRACVPDLPRQAELIRKLEMIMTTVEDRVQIPPKNKEILSFMTSQPNPQYLDFVRQADPFMYPPCFEAFANLKFNFGRSIANSIRHAFESHLVPSLTENIMKCFVTDNSGNGPVTVCNKDLFLYITPDSEGDFFKALVQTNSFESFCARLTDEFEETQAHAPVTRMRTGYKSMAMILPSEKSP